jgi:hypothetical protein
MTRTAACCGPAARTPRPSSSAPQRLVPAHVGPGKGGPPRELLLAGEHLPSPPARTSEHHTGPARAGPHRKETARKHARGYRPRPMAREPVTSGRRNRPENRRPGSASRRCRQKTTDTHTEGGLPRKTGDCGAPARPEDRHGCQSSMPVTGRSWGFNVSEDQGLPIAHPLALTAAFGLAASKLAHLSSGRGWPLTRMPFSTAMTYRRPGVLGLGVLILDQRRVVRK